MNLQKTIVNKPSTHPWKRFFARHIDLTIASFIFGIFFGIFLKLLFPAFSIVSHARTFGLISSIIAVFLWVFIEAFFLSTWGTTFGKWFLNIRIQHNEGKKLGFSHALKRSFLVWYRGMGCEIPIILLCTQYNAYFELTKNGITSWDRDCHLSIQHKKLGVIKKIALVLLMVLYVLFFMYREMHQLKL